MLKIGYMAIERVPLKSSPRLFDRVFGELQVGLAERFAWLDHIFGKAERVAEKKGGVRIVSPAVYTGGNDYLNITPDDMTLGNYCFFTLDDPQDVEYLGMAGRVKAHFSLVVWLDLRTVEAEDERNVEAVKSAILKALSGGVLLRSGSVRVHRVFEHPESVFSGFSYNYTDAQAAMHPYCALRFSGEIVTNDNCI